MFPAGFLNGVPMDLALVGLTSWSALRPHLCVGLPTEMDIHRPASRAATLQWTIIASALAITARYLDIAETSHELETVRRNVGNARGSYQRAAHLMAA